MSRRLFDAIDKLDHAKKMAVQYMNEHHAGRQWFLVGGALRDTELGKPFKDFDIFVVGYETDPVPLHFNGEKAEAGDRNAYLMKAYTVRVEDIDLNLIFMRGDWDLKGIADRCDFGICQIAWCPVTRETYRSEKYEADIKNKTLTVDRATVPERYDRMQAKFPEYTIRNPSNLPTSTGSWHYKDGKVVQVGSGEDWRA